MIRAIIYSRVSTAKQVQGHGLVRQYETCMDYADEHGYTVLEVIEDVILGAAYDRPGLWRVRRLVQAGVVDVVLIEQRDRWTRGAVGIHELEDSFCRKRDNFTCQVCDLDLEEYPDRLTVGHKIDKACGGSDRGSNLCLQCVRCNPRKPHHRDLAQYEEWIERGGVLPGLLRAPRKEGAA